MGNQQLRELSLFTGYGGFSLGLRLAGLEVQTVGYIEIEPYCQEIIKARIKDGLLDDAPIFPDIRAFDGTQCRGVVDLVSGGFPCQPHSVAGAKRGATDQRNLWPDTLRVIREVAPRFVLLENVPGLLSGSTDERTPAYGGVVVGELASLGYSVHWRTLGADDVGAPHRRKRWWCLGVLADASSGRYGEPPEEVRTGGDTTEHGIGELADDRRNRGYPTWPPGPSDTDGWERVLRERPDLAPALHKEVESQFRGVDHGRSHRVDELRVLGNGIVPAVVAEFLNRVHRLTETSAA